METESPASVLEREHRDIDAAIEGCAGGTPLDEASRDRLTQAVHALRRHIYIEEEFLFPPMTHAGMHGPVLVMLHEHAEIWDALDVLERALALHADEAAISTLCRELALRLDHHNAKEEMVLYPRAEQILPEEASEELAAVIASGDLPDGWACLGGA